MTKTLREDVDMVVAKNTYRIPAGMRVSLNLRAHPMDPRFVDDPSSYVPERFLPDAVLARAGTPSGAALDHPCFADPFGRGKRRCLGSNLAIAEISVLAARMIQDYEVSLVDPRAEWRPKQKLMLMADPYPDIKLVRRVWEVDISAP
jgi:cytochrome P450